MTGAAPFPGEHLLLYEPRTEGHHLGWLRFIVEDLLSATTSFPSRWTCGPRRKANCAITWPACWEGETPVGLRRLQPWHGGGKAGSVVRSLRASGAARVFLCAFDEIASVLLAAGGLRPYPSTRAAGPHGGHLSPAPLLRRPLVVALTAC